MQIASSRLAVPISYDDNHFTTRATSGVSIKISNIFLHYETNHFLNYKPDYKLINLNHGKHF